MSAPSIGDCAACREAITDLVCDELDAATRDAVLAHARECRACSAELAKFRAVLRVADAIPLQAPSSRVHAAVMLAAREANVRRAALAQVPKASESSFDVLRAWLGQIGSWAMSPQVAMASVLLLMLGVGLVALPLGQDREQTALQSAEEADQAPPPATATGAAVPTASPPASEEDESRKKLREEKEQLGQSDGVQPSRSNDTPSARRRDAAQSANEKLAAKDDILRDEPLKGVQKPARGELSEVDRDLGLAAGSGGAQKSAEMPAPSKRAFPSAAQAEGSSANRAAPAADFAAPPPEPAMAAAPVRAEPIEAVQTRSSLEEKTKKSESTDDSAVLARGIAAFRRADYATAITLLRSLLDHPTPTLRREASLWLARSYRASDQCSAALRLYAPLLAAGSAQEQVLSEAADCYERTGDPKQAAAVRNRMSTRKTSKASPSKPASKAPKQ